MILLQETKKWDRGPAFRVVRYLVRRESTYGVWDSSRQSGGIHVYFAADSNGKTSCSPANDSGKPLGVSSGSLPFPSDMDLGRRFPNFSLYHPALLVRENTYLSFELASSESRELAAYRCLVGLHIFVTGSLLKNNLSEPSNAT